MLDTEPTGAGSNGASNDNDNDNDSGAARPRRRRAASRPAGPPQAASAAPAAGSAAAAEPEEPRHGTDAPSAQARPARRRPAKKTAAANDDQGDDRTGDQAPGDAADAPAKTTSRRTRKKSATAAVSNAAATEPATSDAVAGEPAPTAAFQPPGVLFQAPDAVVTPPRRRSAAASADTSDADGAPGEGDEDDEDTVAGEGGARRRRRGGRGRRSRGGGKAGGEGGSEDQTDGGEDGEQEETGDTAGQPAADQDEAEFEETGEGGTRRRRRRRRRGTGEDGVDPAPDDPPNTVVRVREPRKSTRAKSSKSAASDRGDDGDARALKGSTRLEAKKQRRREGRDAGRRRPAIITEAEFLARRESVDRVMVVRQTGERTQIGVLEDGILVEHYVSTASSAGTLGNVYLGKVQNVLPSMEAAFVDVGKGRNAVLYAGEVNWDAAGMDGQPKRIEQALKPNDSVLVQVTKDPIGHKGARLTSQISLAGRYLVYVPHGSMTGISRKLPENERTRLKSILKKIVPEEAGVIVRTAAEGASEEELSRDVARLTAQWEDIEKKAKTASAPALLYGEPDLTIRVVRDIFNEDFAKLIVSGDDAWEMLEPYVGHVAPDLRDRMSRWTSEEDVFAAHRIDEQLAKALDRKVWLPSGGYLIIDRTEAMIVIDVNTGKFTGAGGNLEETVTKNNVEAAEEIVRQLRLRDLGGMIVIDFIDMVLESNRELVLRRMLECLGRDRTKHQVAEVTSLGLVQMTRKRVGQGLFEAFSETCEACNGRGVHIRTEPVEAGGGPSGGSSERKNGRSRGGSERSGGARGSGGSGKSKAAESAVAAEDPVEPAGSGDSSEPGGPDGSGQEQDAPKAPRRRRRRAEAPVTSV
jgi:ribonuclease E